MQEYLLDLLISYNLITDGNCTYGFYRDIFCVCCIYSIGSRFITMFIPETVWIWYIIIPSLLILKHEITDGCTCKFTDCTVYAVQKQSLPKLYTRKAHSSSSGAEF